jgi:hypothetical protein
VVDVADGADIDVGLGALELLLGHLFLPGLVPARAAAGIV